MSYKNKKRTYKEIVDQVRMALECHQELGDSSEDTVKGILKVFEESDIRIEGGYEF